MIIHSHALLGVSAVGRYVLKYREPGKRPGTERWATRRVDSVAEALVWMNENKSVAFLPAFVETPGNRWQRPETVAIFGGEL